MGQPQVSSPTNQHYPPPSIKIPERKSSRGFAERVKAKPRKFSVPRGKEEVVVADDDDVSTVVDSVSSRSLTTAAKDVIAESHENVIRIVDDYIKYLLLIKFVLDLINSIYIKRF